MAANRSSQLIRDKGANTMYRLRGLLFAGLGSLALSLSIAPGYAVSLPEPTQDSDYYETGRPNPDKVALGKILFFDKILSGNKNISCATCHSPFTATSDGLSLPVGEGDRGLSVTRSIDGIVERVPRNSPALFNLGATEFTRMFHDGRVEVDPSSPSGFASPAGDDLPFGLDNVLAAQAMFPVTSAVEMAGQSRQNSIGKSAADGDHPGVWEKLAMRLRDNRRYVALFKAAFADISASDDITFVHAANAIAAFEAQAWRADNAPFDRLLRGDTRALSATAKRGMKIFYGRGQCSQCHSGVFQTDHLFHSIALPPIGPGKGDGPTGHDDFGREQVTGDADDRYRFRTPSLRNVVLTGPWGHNGAYNSLEEIVRHHLDSESALMNYAPDQVVLADRADLNTGDFIALADPDIYVAINESSNLPQINLREREIDELIEFLHSLTDPNSLDLRRDFPRSVPSGLPIAD